VRDLPDGCEISINLIPHTLHNTALGSLDSGSRVNLEIDLIARYVERMLSNKNPSDATDAAQAQVANTNRVQA
jgi:riboflavin synthase